MSRIGKQPVELPNGVKAEIGPTAVNISGPLGKLDVKVPANIKVKETDNTLTVEGLDDKRETIALTGLTRALLANGVYGVTSGFEKRLELQGVGYRVRKEGTKLNLTLGLSHPVVVESKYGNELQVDGQTAIIVKGIDREKVGLLAAEIRRLRPPEVYRGKGIRYSDEVVRRKETKKS